MLHTPTPVLKKNEEGTSVDKQPFDRGASPELKLPKSPKTSSKTEISDKKVPDLGDKVKITVRPSPVSVPKKEKKT